MIRYDANEAARTRAQASERSRDRRARLLPVRQLLRELPRCLHLRLHAQPDDAHAAGGHGGQGARFQGHPAVRAVPHLHRPLPAQHRRRRHLRGSEDGRHRPGPRRARARQDLQRGLHERGGPLRPAARAVHDGHVLPGHHEPQDGHGRRGPGRAHAHQGQDGASCRARAKGADEVGRIYKKSMEKAKAREKAFTEAAAREEAARAAGRESRRGRRAAAATAPAPPTAAGEGEVAA